MRVRGTRDPTKRFSHVMVLTIRDHALAGLTSNADVAAVLQREHHPGITSADVARWRAEHHRFNAAIVGAQAAMDARAIGVIGDAIDGGDVATAKWWLERRNANFKPASKVEFGGRIEHLDARLSRRLSESDLRARGVIIDVDADAITDGR